VFAAVSVGIALGTAKYDEPDDVLRDADAAMYVAKSQGRARAIAFDESIGKVLRDNVDLTADLPSSETNCASPINRSCD
jgi:predicted signal transduction protein with EAL and GGDEF domain